MTSTENEILFGKIYTSTGEAGHMYKVVMVDASYGGKVHLNRVHDGAITILPYAKMLSMIKNGYLK
jgi:hypothetical protein